MPNLVWHDYLLVLSFVASIVGLCLLLGNDKQAQKADDFEETEETLLKMTFAYWMVYCLAMSIQKLTLPVWDELLLSLKLTAIISYFLTFSCILSLPLHHIQVRRQAQ
jgi:hypothetical protein